MSGDHHEKSNSCAKLVAVHKTGKSIKMRTQSICYKTDRSLKYKKKGFVNYLL